jgi:hypothetical protein
MDDQPWRELDLARRLLIAVDAGQQQVHRPLAHCADGLSGHGNRLTKQRHPGHVVVASDLDILE